jgi:hypothetical protein
MLREFDDRDARRDPPWFRAALWFAGGFVVVLLIVSAWRGNW